jgi:dienelactone hydrolase
MGEELALLHYMPRQPLFATVRRSSRMGRGLVRIVDLAHGREMLPATWLTPPGGQAAPAVLLLHGLSSNRDRMVQGIGRPLLAHGIGSLALDLPYHGERGAATGEIPKNPLALVAAWRGAVTEARLAAEWLAAQPEVDAGRLGVVGYSLGGFLALMTATDEPALRVIALAAAGDLPDQLPYAKLIRGVVDPLRAVSRLKGRSLLLVNGRRDTTTRPAQAERLFAAASEPKTMRWYDGGHWPPAATIEDTARWLAEQLDASKVRGREAAG